jgi:hypothetical protein
MFEDAGHALFVDDADKFNMLLDDLLTSLKYRAMTKNRETEPKMYQNCAWS